MLTEQEILALQERNKQLEDINKEITTERAQLKESLKAYKEAEAEAKAAAEKAEAEAKIEAEIQARVNAEIAKLDTLGVVKKGSEVETPEPNDSKPEDKEEAARQAKIKEVAELLRY